jgi:lipooligosaccharide transport system ATP-binding protein
VSMHLVPVRPGACVRFSSIFDTTSRFSEDAQGEPSPSGPPTVAPEPAGSGLSVSRDAVRAHEVVKSYGRRRALDGFSASIHTGTCTGIMGPNGAGKSTFSRLLYGRIARDSGDLEVLGLDPSTHSRALRSRIGVINQDNFLDPDLSVLDNLVLFGLYHGLRRRVAVRRALTCLELFDLTDRSAERVMELSGGMQRRLTLARALVHEPELIILDEPTTGLDPISRLGLWELLDDLRTEGHTIILSTHDLNEAEQLCDDIVVIEQGAVLDQATPDGLIHRHLDRDDVDTDEPAPSGALEEVYIELFGEKNEGRP